MRIQMVLLNLEIGGLERVVVDLCRALAEAGDQIAVVTLRGAGPLAGPLAEAGIPVTELHTGDGLRVSTLLALRRAIRRFQPDVVHSHGEAALFYTGLLALAGAGFRHVHSRHGYEDISARGIWRNRLAHRGCDAVACVSADLAHHVRDVERLPPERLHTVVNGIDLTPYRALSAAPYSAEAPVVAHVARLAPVKNQRLLLQAFAELLQRWPKARLEIIGDGPERPALEAQAADCGLTHAVRFHGAVPDVARRLAACHLFCLTSDSEGTPASVLEALAAGRPVVATRVGGLPALLEEPAGALVAPGDSVALADAIQRLYRDAERYRCGTVAARQTAETLDLGVMVEAYQRLYDG